MVIIDYKKRNGRYSSSKCNNSIVLLWGECWFQKLWTFLTRIFLVFSCCFLRTAACNLVLAPPGGAVSRTNWDRLSQFNTYWCWEGWTYRCYLINAWATKKRINNICCVSSDSLLAGVCIGDMEDWEGTLQKWAKKVGKKTPKGWSDYFIYQPCRVIMQMSKCCLCSGKFMQIHDAKLPRGSMSDCTRWITIGVLHFSTCWVSPSV